MTDRDLVAVLERAVDAVSPRDPDPVGAVIRRVRARRRRIIAGSAAVVLLAAGAGLAGFLATGQGSVRTGPPADGTGAGPVRQVAPWSGATATLRGVTVPVPEGWQVEDADPTPDGRPCLGRPADRTVFLVRSGAGWMPCDRIDGSFVVVASVPLVYPNGVGNAPSLELDPSSQPVWTGGADLGKRPSDRVRELRLVFSRVVVTTWGFDPDRADTYLSQVSAELGGPTGGIEIPSHAVSANYVDYAGAEPGDPTYATGWSRDLPRQVGDLLSPTGNLSCLPAAEDLSVAFLDRGSDAPDGSNGQQPAVISFDRTGACDVAFDGRGGLARVDGPALHSLLRSWTRNAPIPATQPDPPEVTLPGKQ
jgi:hypothetical protein